MGESVQTLKNVARCPHCSISNPMIVQYWSGTTMDAMNIRNHWAFYACLNCGGGVAAKGPDNNSLVFGLPAEMFPHSPEAHQDIPPIARKFLQQAMDTLHAPDAAAVMAGSAVDAMLKELGYSNGSVYQRIDQALDDNKLTQGMADWAHSVRLGSNRPRHADASNPHVSFEEAKQSVDFAEALGNFLFVLTARVSRGIAAASSASAPS